MQLFTWICHGSTKYRNFLDNFEEQLQKNTDEFNNMMGVHGFNVEYKVLNKNPGIIYRLMMTYKEFKLNNGDILLHSMHIPEEIITNIKTLLRQIQN